MLWAALADGGAVDYASFILIATMESAYRSRIFDHSIAAYTCHPEQAQATAGSKRASKDPEHVSVRHAASGSSHNKLASYCNAL